MNLKIFGFLFFIFCLVVDFGCTKTPTTAQKVSFDPRNAEAPMCLPKFIRAFMRTKANSMDPAMIISYMDNQLALTAFGQLVALDEYENIRPYLAKSWTISKDGLEYSFVLDTRYRFSNGKPVTAEDVVYTFNRLFSSKLNSKVANYLFGENIVGTAVYRSGGAASLAGISALGVDTVKFRLIEARSNFLSMLTMGPSSILPTGTPMRVIMESEIISAGPFMIAAFSPVSVDLSTNAHFPDHLSLTTIEYRYRDEDVCNALKSGIFDFIDAGPFDSAVCSSPEYDLTHYPGANIWFISFGNKISSDVRRKIISCVDPSEYLMEQNKNHTSAIRLQGLFPTQNNQASVRLLAQPTQSQGTCALPQPAHLKLLVSNRHHLTEKLPTLFSKIKNLTVKLIKADDTIHHTARASGAYDMLFTEFTGTFSDPTFYSSLFVSKGSVVTSGYVNATYDLLASKLAGAVSSEERTSAIKNLEDLISQDPPAIFLKQHENIEWLRSSLQLKHNGWFARYFFTVRNVQTNSDCLTLKGK